MKINLKTKSGKNIVILKEKTDPLAMRFSIGGDPKIGYYLTFRGDNMEKLEELLEEAPNPNWNQDLYKITDNLQIPRTNIVFCSMNDKYEYIQNQNFIWHLDDDWEELRLINTLTHTKGISIFGNQECEQLINAKPPDASKPNTQV